MHGAQGARGELLDAELKGTRNGFGGLKIEGLEGHCKETASTE